MVVNIERVIVTLVIASFAFTSINILFVHGGSLTMEEAIEISRNSRFVQSLLEDSDRYTLEVHYLNQTQVNGDHGVWDIVGYIHPKGASSSAADVISHRVDEETGEILREGYLVAR
ncbi:MAG: hypothetical protein OEX77_02200 [Candidatus Bathyarchaeota archaeon]|nr:hypothetical protein [Candidatus Bathyarchaeota archaeon]MDH5733091.1 hypothetical protein [Candidatus Bathyarchaeota archaeon]